MAEIFFYFWQHVDKADKSKGKRATQAFLLEFTKSAKVESSKRCAER